MNDSFKDFITNIGILCETWTIAYQKFIAMGLDHATAIEHTKELIATIMAASRNNGDNNGT